MTMIEIRLDSGDPLCRALIGLAERRSERLEDVLREILSEAVEQAQDREWVATGNNPDGVAEGLLGAVREALACARSWPELQGRLMLKGCALRDGPHGLVISSHPGDVALWPLNMLGLSRDALERRLGAHFPDRAGIGWNESEDADKRASGATKTVTTGRLSGLTVVGADPAPCEAGSAGARFLRDPGRRLGAKDGEAGTPAVFAGPDVDSAERRASPRGGGSLFVSSRIRAG